jgi:hypothetical protein
MSTQQKPYTLLYHVVYLLLSLCILDSPVLANTGKNSPCLIFDIPYQRKYIQPDISLLRAFEIPVDAFRLSSFGENLYLQTWSSQSFYQINPQNGQIIRTFGRKGNGPGEFMQIDNVSIDRKAVYIFDRQHGSISEFTHQGMLNRTYKLSEGALRGVLLEGTTFLLKPFGGGTTSEEIFSVVDVTTNNSTSIKARRIKPSEADDMSRPLELDGPFIRNGNGVVFRVSVTAGQFLAFGAKGNPLYVRKTLDQTEPPPPTAKSVNGQQYVTYGAGVRDINTAAWADTKHLYILSNAPSPDIPTLNKAKNTIGVVDIYKVKNGDYLYSFKIPEYKTPNAPFEPPSSFVIANGKLYTICGVTICTYSLKLPWTP